MAAAAERHYLDALEMEPSRLSGIATTRHGHGVPTRRIKVIEAGHPVPDEAGLKGAEDSLRLAHAASADDLLLVLLSGGGSANWIAPAEGVSFAQKQQVTRALLRSGAPIGEVNTVRKHLSRIKGGRLARAGQHAEIVTLAISDVPHDDPSAIASGPTVPDPTTLADARALVAKYDLKLDDAVTRALDDANNESCKPGDAAFARAQFRADRAAQGFARGRHQAGKRRGLRHRRPRRRSRRRSTRRRRRSRAVGAAGPRGGQARGDPLGRRTHRDRARQRARRPQPGICAGAGGPAQGHARAFRRWLPIPTAPMAAPAAPTIPRAP